MEVKERKIGYLVTYKPKDELLNDVRNYYDARSRMIIVR